MWASSLGGVFRARGMRCTVNSDFLPNWGKLEGSRCECKVSLLHLIGKQFEIMRDAVEFPIIMRDLHFLEDRVHVAVVLKPRVLISDEHGNRYPASDLPGIGAG